MKNELYIRIDGLNLVRLLNRLVENNIFLNEVKFGKNYLKFKINENDLPKLKNICKKEHKNYKIISRFGFLNIFSKIPYHFGAFLAFIISFAYMLSYNMYITSVNFVYEAPYEYDLSAVQNFVTNEGVVVGANRFKINPKNLENMLLENIDDISGCRISKQGGVVDIFVYPTATKYGNKNENLNSRFNAQVTYAEAYVGKLKIKSGDVVQTGETLIENDNGAFGKVTGIINVTSYSIYNENQIEFTKTGKSYTVRNLKFFNKYLYKGENNSGFLNFKTENCVFYLNKNLFIPFLIEEEKIVEVVANNKKIPFSDVEDDVKDKLYKETLQKVPQGGEVKNVVYSVVSEDNYTRVDCFIECEISLI